MKKPKISLDQEKLQAFFLNHIEKILLVIVLLLMVMLVLGGLRLEHLGSRFTPQALVTESDDTKRTIDQERWTEISVKRMPDFNVVKGVTEVQKKTEPIAYALPNSLARPDFPKLSPRQDPVLFAPEHLVVRPVI